VKRIGTVLIGAWGPGLAVPDDQNDCTNERDQTEKHKPSATSSIVQTADCNCNARQQQSKAGQRIEYVGVYAKQRIVDDGSAAGSSRNCSFSFICGGSGGNSHSQSCFRASNALMACSSRSAIAPTKSHS
jgi:hypothetical protein